MTTFEALPLYPFQEEDVHALEEEPSALLGWEMGTGKTLAGIERDRRIRKAAVGAAPTLVVAPLSTLDSWEAHFEEYTPLVVSKIDPKNRAKFLQKKAHIYLMHWDALRLMPELRDVGFQHVLADEVHRAKNRKAKMTKALKRIKAPFKTGMSGTPATNRPQDLWSILNWLYPGVYTSYWAFYNKYVDFEIGYPHGYHIMKGVKNVESLQNRIRPFYKERLKVDVLPDLPPKMYERIWVTLKPEQRRAYNEMREDMIAWVGEHEDEPLVAPVVIARLNRLMQFALGYMTWDEEQEKFIMSEPSAKLDAVMEILSDNQDEQFVVFSQWKSPLYLLGKRLEAKEITHAFFTGDQSADERTTNKAGFVSGSNRLLLGTVGAGGVGVDGLQRASSTVIFLDRAWSPAENRQAEDRLHRVGQESAVTVIDIMARDTVDLGRLQRIEQKWKWIRQLLGGEVQNGS